MPDFDTIRPKDTHTVADLTNIMRSQRSSLDLNMRSQMHWSDDTANAGQLYNYDGSSTATLSTIRAFIGPSSSMSTGTGRNGQFYITSDTTRLGYIGSGISCYLGSSRAVRAYVNWADGKLCSRDSSRVIVSSGTTGDTGVTELCQSGNSIVIPFTDSAGALVVHGSPPVVTFSVMEDDPASKYIYTLSRISETHAELKRAYIGSGAAPSSGYTVFWTSSGTTDVI